LQNNKYQFIVKKSEQNTEGSNMCLYSLKIILLIENLKKTTTTTTNYHQMQPDNQTRARKWHLPNCCL